MSSISEAPRGSGEQGVGMGVAVCDGHNVFVCPCFFSVHTQAVACNSPRTIKKTEKYRT